MEALEVLEALEALDALDVAECLLRSQILSCVEQSVLLVLHNLA